MIVIELGGSRLFCTNHNGVETELNECIRVRNTRRPLLFMYKRLVVERASIYIINPEVWFLVADELITGLSSGGILGLNDSLDNGRRGYVSCRIVHDVPIQMELCLRKRMDNNLLLGLEIAFIVDTVKLTIKEKYLSEMIHFFLGIYYCLFRLDVVTEIYGPDPHGEGYTTSSVSSAATSTAPSTLGSSQSSTQKSTATSTPVRGTIRRDQFGREERENLDRLDAEMTSTGTICPLYSNSELLLFSLFHFHLDALSLHLRICVPHFHSLVIILLFTILISSPPICILQLLLLNWMSMNESTTGSDPA